MIVIGTPRTRKNIIRPVSRDDCRFFFFVTLTRVLFTFVVLSGRFFCFIYTYSGVVITKIAPNLFDTRTLCDLCV